MITLENLEILQTILMDLTTERKTIYNDLLDDKMFNLAEHELKRINSLCEVIEIVQVHKEYLIDLLDEIKKR